MEIYVSPPKTGGSGTITQIVAGTGITVTSPTGPHPTISVTTPTMDQLTGDVTAGPGGGSQVAALQNTANVQSIVAQIAAYTTSANAITLTAVSPISRFKVTNNSSAAATITLATAGVSDGWTMLVSFYDFAAVAEALTFINTENSTISVPANSNGSTTLPITIGFKYNGATSKWRCLAVA
jgi:hypothetical protein